MSDQVPCDDVREVAPDIALGLLTGEERADALAHLERCDGCRAEVASLALAVDEVLLAAPEVTPPTGFADRVLARLAAETATADGRPAGDGLPAVSGPPAAAPGGPPLRRPRSRPRRPLAVAALAVAAAVLAVAGLVAVVRGGGADGVEAAVAEMRTGAGEVVGTATAEGDDTTRVTLDVPGWDSMVEHWGQVPAGGYRIVVEQEDGTRTTRALGAGDGGRSLDVDAPVDDLVTVSVLDAEGRVWCTGRFAPA